MFVSYLVLTRYYRGFHYSVKDGHTSHHTNDRQDRSNALSREDFGSPCHVLEGLAAWVRFVPCKEKDNVQAVSNRGHALSTFVVGHSLMMAFLATLRLSTSGSVTGLVVKLNICCHLFFHCPLVLRT